MARRAFARDDSKAHRGMEGGSPAPKRRPGSSSSRAVGLGAIEVRGMHEIGRGGGSKGRSATRRR